jgi:Tol biopolymer transport system component
MKQKLLIILLIICAKGIIFYGCTQCSLNQNEFKTDYLGQSKPGERPEIFAKGIISTLNQEHSSLAFTPDGKEIMWSIWPLPHDQNNYPQVIKFIKSRDGQWSQPDKVSFSGIYMDGGPTYSADGNRVYFYSKRPIDESTLEMNDLDIWFVERQNNDWGKPINIGEPVNTDYMESSPSLSSNGNLYFVSNRNQYKDPIGNNDIFVSYLKNGAYEIPVSLGNNINTAHARESFPFIALDESYIIFTRDSRKFNSSRKLISGKRILMISFKGELGQWEKAVEMGGQFENARFPSVSPDGKFLFFTKYTDNNNEDYYWVDAKIIEELRFDFFR